MNHEPVARVEFTREMKKDYTILVPNMLPIHFEMICEILRQEGYKIELLTTSHSAIVEEGLKYVHNDTCYPALLVIGQMIDALKSGRYDVDHTALLISQTGGGCRASNYLSLLRKALQNAGFPQVPAISINFKSELESNSGFKLSLLALVKASFAMMYGDMLMWIANQCRPYEVQKGQTQALVEKWTRKLTAQFRSPRCLMVRRNYKRILHDFGQIALQKRERVPVGIVGEIYMKYASLGNNALEDFLVSQGAEPVLSGLMDFCLYCTANAANDHRLYGNAGFVRRASSAIARFYLVKRQDQMIRAIQKDGRFLAPSRFDDVEKLADGMIGRGAKMGEGWLLTAEMMELIHSGVKNIVCTQPFGCLPNHIVAKGMIRKIKERYPEANIVAVDYDPGASRINQENRLKLMLANARESYIAPAAQMGLDLSPDANLESGQERRASGDVS
ncbi:2-hydroxyacyl-CoA dehydratase [Christensenellaceae bacterium NSJ-44]|uniref:2-hydroxyacyl-CoA dehydratase n=1 Tax=Luoshenia tenuis TaxID=2763654 RepID=A0A926CY98_9FIRM|nr:2-hydroxyacyl-CoA dehydratase [Luoshenia tenuis]MBC8528174.1 2-hydroxyacyl-CoA dehydratase [Luoshenia tenuis]